MARSNSIQHGYVDVIPAQLEEGRLLISKKYRTAVHLCCCGCGHEVVTPLNSTKWQLADHGKTVSLYPSIGNWSFPCQAHYWIDCGTVKWARKMSRAQIERVRAEDHRALHHDAGVGETTIDPNSQLKKLHKLGFIHRLKNWYCRRV